jgi:hypothetical protein
MDEYSIGLAVKFAESLGKNSSAWVSNKIAQAKEKKQDEE